MHNKYQMEDYLVVKEKKKKKEERRERREASQYGWLNAIETDRQAQIS